MSFDWSTLALQTINVAVLVWLLGRFFFKPVAGMIAARQEAARRLLADAESAKQAAESERDKASQARIALEAGRADAIRAIDAEVASERAALLEDARNEAVRLRAAAEADLAHEATSRQKAMQADAVELAASMTDKLLARLPRDTRIASFVDGLTAAYAALPSTSRDDLARTGEPLTLCVPCEPTAAERAMVEDALSRVHGHDVRLDVVIEPGLIAGLELRGNHLVVSNNLRRDLDEIRESLAETDEAIAEPHA